MNSIAWSPDGRWVATAEQDGTLRVHDPATGRSVHALTEARTALLSVAWSPDSTRLAASGYDGRIRIYDVARDRAVLTGEVSGTSTQGGVVGLAFSPDGDRLLAGDNLVRSANVWDVGEAGAAEVMAVPGSPGDAAGVAFDRDGRLLTAGARGSVSVWDEETASSTTAFGDPHGRVPHARSLAVSPGGGLVGVGETPDGVRVWDSDSGEELFTSATGFRWRPAFTTDEDLVAVGGPDSLTVQDISGSVLAHAAPDPGHTFGEPAFSPDGRTVAVLHQPADPGAEGEWELVWWDWRADEQRTSSSPAGGHRPAYSPDGSRLAIADVGAPPRVVDVGTQEQAFTLEGHSGGVADLAWSPDGSHIATAGLDGTAIVWDGRDGSIVVRLPSLDHELFSVAFSPDGSHLATGSSGGEPVQVWTLDVEELREIARGKVTRSLTDVECRRYLHAPCSDS